MDSSSNNSDCSDDPDILRCRTILLNTDVDVDKRYDDAIAVVCENRKSFHDAKYLPLILEHIALIEKALTKSDLESGYRIVEELRGIGLNVKSNEEDPFEDFRYKNRMAEAIFTFIKRLYESDLDIQEKNYRFVSAILVVVDLLDYYGHGKKWNQIGKRTFDSISQHHSASFPLAALFVCKHPELAENIRLERYTPYWYNMIDENLYTHGRVTNFKDWWNFMTNVEKVFKFLGRSKRVISMSRYYMDRVQTTYIKSSLSYGNTRFTTPFTDFPRFRTSRKSKSEQFPKFDCFLYKESEMWINHLEHVQQPEKSNAVKELAIHIVENFRQILSKPTVEQKISHITMNTKIKGSKETELLRKRFVENFFLIPE